MQTIDFDLDRFIRTSGRVDLSEVEWARASRSPLTDTEVRVLRYMMDIETNTVIFLRDVLATQTAFDPDVTAFLSCWNFEELWHGEAFSRLLGEAGVPVRPDHETVTHDSRYPSRRSRIEWIRRRIGAKGYVSHLGTLLGSAIASEDFIAIHMTWGAVNELTTLTAYRRMIAKTENVALTEVLRAIIKQERRHFAFYRAQARVRLAESQRARRLVRWTHGSSLGARRHRYPAAGGDRSSSWPTCSTIPTAAVASKEMDGIVAELPGLEGTHYLCRSSPTGRRAAGRCHSGDSAAG